MGYWITIKSIRNSWHGYWMHSLTLPSPAKQYIYIYHTTCLDWACIQWVKSTSCPVQHAVHCETTSNAKAKRPFFPTTTKKTCFQSRVFTCSESWFSNLLRCSHGVKTKFETQYLVWCLLTVFLRCPPKKHFASYRISVVLLRPSKLLQTCWHARGARSKLSGRKNWETYIDTMPCAIIPLDYTIGFLAKALTLTLSGIDAPTKK